MDLLLAVVAGDDEEMSTWWQWLDVRTRRLITHPLLWRQVETIAARLGRLSRARSQDPTSRIRSTGNPRLVETYQEAR
jgi:hypothetical protein